MEYIESGVLTDVIENNTLEEGQISSIYLFGGKYGFWMVFVSSLSS